MGLLIMRHEILVPTLRRGNAYRDQHIDRCMGSHAGAWEPVNELDNASLCALRGLNDEIFNLPL